MWITLLNTELGKPEVLGDLLVRSSAYQEE